MDEQILLSVFVAVEGAHAFSAFMPSYFTVKKFADQSEDVSRLRSGYVPAVAFNVALGSLVSALTRKPAPLIMTIIVSIFMIAMYEGAVGRVYEGEVGRVQT